MKTLTIRLRRRVADEAGAALVVVLALSITMLILITAALSFSLSGVKTARNDSDSTSALAAAYAGIDEYSSRLSNDSRYQGYGNPNSPFTIATGSEDTVALPPADEENPAFGIGATGTWATIAGSDGRASFRYEVDNSHYSGTGTLRVRSTGRVGDETQSIVADLKQTGFIDFLYFSEHEIMDPDISDTRCGDDGKRPSDWAAVKSGSTVKHGSYCTEIQFGEHDILDGKVHSNDILRVCGATFKRAVTTATKIVSPEYVHSCSTDGIFTDPKNAGGVIPRVAEMNMPPTNGEMQKEARVDLDIARPGCMYTGPTQITFNSNGTVNVVSPWTKVTQPSLTVGIPNGSGAECGDIGAMHTSAGSTFTPPGQNLLYVQGVPKDSTDPNYWAEPVWIPGSRWSSGYWSGGETPAGFTCNNSGASNEGWVFKQPSSGATVRYPLSNERTPEESSSSSPSYGCVTGDAYIKGTVSGQITVASANFVYITGDLLYNDTAVDVLGIVGNNAVWVWNPMNTSSSGYGCSSSRCPMTAKNRTINGAILSVKHTFQVQNYAIGGDRGVLTVNGAIAQKFRGTVGRGSNGYDKSYNYDARLFAISPPKFLLPTSTTYGVTKYALVQTAFSADGATIP